ncbi:RNA polymerase sigma factor [Marinifilum flexuosum]|uniref:RNA polymerase sigma factor n=1 Tax=Marinifilum flexuosum TaxID=1117708 RepID=UPI00249214CD|nr:sigma-70 family RNA polymerase sigma factor [Marinifilum flexuosum]
MSICESNTFKRVFDKYSETIRNFIYYKCGDLEKAEDLTQEAFIKLWNNCAKVLLDKAKSFLFTVANNLFLNDYAHEKVILQHRKSITIDQNTETPQFIIEEEEFKQKLKNAIANLTSAQREVFLLNRIDKKTYKEIAVIVGISEKAVEKRMHNALVNLRKEIKNHI